MRERGRKNQKEVEKKRKVESENKNKIKIRSVQPLIRSSIYQRLSVISRRLSGAGDANVDW
jgi:hypothetical protein